MNKLWAVLFMAASFEASSSISFYSKDKNCNITNGIGHLGIQEKGGTPLDHTRIEVITDRDVERVLIRQIHPMVPGWLFKKADGSAIEVNSDFYLTRRNGKVITDRFQEIYKERDGKFSVYPWVQLNLKYSELKPTYNGQIEIFIEVKCER